MRKTVRFRSRSRKKKAKRKRPYKGTKGKARLHHAHRRHRRRFRRHAYAKHVASSRMVLENILKALESQPQTAARADPRHPTKDPEYAFSDERTRQFKDEFPSPDVSFLRPQGEGRPPHVGNFPAHRYRQ